MLKIGDFSKLAHVTVKALRHYASMGLLQPVWTDRFTGYRYYALDQLPRLNRILALKDLGFSLDQIRELLDVDLPPARLRQLFNQRQQDLHQRLEAEQARLQRVAERLEQIEHEGHLPEYEVILKAIPSLPVAMVRAMVPVVDELPEQCNLMKHMIESWATSIGIHSSGPWMVLYHNPEYHNRNLDVQVALVLDRQIHLVPGQRNKAIQFTMLPAVESMASLLQPSGKEQTESLYTAIYTWTERNGYHIIGPTRELSLNDPSVLQSQFIGLPSSQNSFTEIQIPVESNLIYRQKYSENPYRKENEMEPKFVSLPAFTVVGMRYYGKNQNREISALWGEANRRLGELKSIIHDGAYGVCYTVQGAAPGEFEYVAALKVEKEEEVPEGMVVRKVPAAKYAVFTHVGALDKVRDTYDYIYQTWLPQSGHHLSGNYDFEFYNQDFKDFAPDSRFYIYVPIKE